MFVPLIVFFLLTFERLPYKDAISSWHNSFFQNASWRFACQRNHHLCTLNCRYGRSFVPAGRNFASCQSHVSCEFSNFRYAGVRGSFNNGIERAYCSQENAIPRIMRSICVLYGGPLWLSGRFNCRRLTAVKPILCRRLFFNVRHMPRRLDLGFVWLFCGRKTRYIVIKWFLAFMESGVQQIAEEISFQMFEAEKFFLGQ